MAPSAIDEPAIKAPEQKTYPPAKIFPVKETRFEDFIEPSTDGRDRALKQSDSAAIVIDNGELGAQGVCDSQELTTHL
jgi:actin-related protein 5